MIFGLLIHTGLELNLHRLIVLCHKETETEVMKLLLTGIHNTRHMRHHYCVHKTTGKQFQILKGCWKFNLSRQDVANKDLLLIISLVVNQKSFTQVTEYWPCPLVTLTLFQPMFHFYAPWKHQKTGWFWCFQGL